MNISITQAKAKFSQIIRKAESGESVTITRHGQPVVVLHPVQHTPTVPKIGSMKGKIEITDDFDELPPEFMFAFKSKQPSK
ncbi:MAG: type II toxin-antitoxin system Phd/YefM family antitoxin [Gammaproteobacteria bacterium]|nr:type II toxin-antitoxin system Phd/YefM family antitoxin [Gammaproteobacteria bacterium]